MGRMLLCISLHLFAASAIQGPLKMHSTVQSSVYARPLRSFGVRRNVCGVPSLLAASVMRLKIFRSFLWSMPWLISSTTRKGARVSSWREMR